MYKCKYKEGEIVGECKIIKILPSKIFGTQGRKVGMALFECPLCGEHFECIISSVKASTKSCGCLAKKISSEVHLKHGKTCTKEYRTWQRIKNRCYNEVDPNYISYGLRGIVVYDKWINDFEAFFTYMGYAPSKKHSIDRIDVNGNYEPGNVRWATTKQQNRNRRSNIMVEYKGETKTLMEWSEVLNISYAALQGRNNRKWDAERMFNSPVSLSSTIRNQVN